MIKITGTNRNEILPLFDYDRNANFDIIESNSAKTGRFDYTDLFSCAPAEVTADSLLLKTYHEINDAKIMRVKATKNNLEITVEVI